MSAALTAAPLSAAAFADLLAPLQPLPSKIAVAVSGGPDSMALAWCLKRWGQSELIALIVDHALRSASAEEAERTKNSLRHIGMNSEILRWDHGPIDHRLHQTARQARYDLLIAACRRYNCNDLMLAHHRDDQAETILMRLAKGSGIAGLAGMAAITMRDELRLLRPFLPIAKARLIATCQQAGLSYVTDAGNDSSRFARGRLRRIMPHLETEGLSVDNLVLLGRRAGQAADAIDVYARQFLRRHGVAGLAGDIILDRAHFAALPQAVAIRALGLCFHYMNDAGYSPDYASLSALCLQCQRSDRARVLTLQGCLARRGEKTIHIMREPAAAAERIAFARGQTAVWDKRWLVRWRSDPGANDSAYQLAALGSPPHALLDRLAPGLRRAIPQGRLRASLPALWQGDRLCFIPDLDRDAALAMSYRKQSFPPA